VLVVFGLQDGPGASAKQTREFEALRDLMDDLAASSEAALRRLTLLYL
jgi:hypothetical protein